VPTCPSSEGRLKRSEHVRSGQDRMMESGTSREAEQGPTALGRPRDYKHKANLGTVIKISWLMLIIPVCTKNRMEPINTKCRATDC
jgi:hypothetical protein